MPDTLALDSLFDSFTRLRVMVFGDVMVDAYLFGTVDRISPEAPVPVVNVGNRLNRMGGAANVALNVHALGAQPLLVSVVGDDEKADLFLRLMKEKQLDPSGLIRVKGRTTTTKFRIFGNKVQMLRVDEETTEEVDPSTEHALLEIVKQQLEQQNVDVIILQDYDKGVLTPFLIKQIIKLAQQHQIPVAVDPKKRNFLQYKDVSLFKPNLKELTEGLGVSLAEFSLAKIQTVVNKLFHVLNPEKVLLTLSEHGVLMAEQNKSGDTEFTHLPAHLRNIADVSGAGDTVISVAGLCLAAGISPRLIAAVSNLAGGLVCEEVGVVPVDKTKLYNELRKLSF